jgi:hypothetical protein
MSLPDTSVDLMSTTRVFVVAFSGLLLAGCAGSGYRYQDTFAELDRKNATTASVIEMLGRPARISHSTDETKEGPPTDTAYRYYFATRDDYPGAKIFYFYEGSWTGENVLGGERRDELFRLLDPSIPSDAKLIATWEAEHPHVW